MTRMNRQSKYKKLSKDVVKDVADRLIDENTDKTTTTLDTKKELRNQGYWAVQADISLFMDALYNDGYYGYDDLGSHRLYYKGNRSSSNIASLPFPDDEDDDGDDSNNDNDSNGHRGADVSQIDEDNADEEPDDDEVSNEDVDEGVIDGNNHRPPLKKDQQIKSWVCSYKSFPEMFISNTTRGKARYQYVKTYWETYGREFCWKKRIGTSLYKYIENIDGTEVERTEGFIKRKFYRVVSAKVHKN